MSKLDVDQIQYLRDVLGIETVVLPASVVSAPVFETAFELGLAGQSEFRTSGDQNAAKIIVLIASETAAFPLEGEAGELAHKMIAAMKYPASHVFIIEWTQAQLGRVPQRVLELLDIDPKPLLVFGTMTASSLIGHIPSFGQWTAWQGTRLVVTDHPKVLLLEPDKKRQAWAHMQLFMKGLS